MSMQDALRKSIAANKKLAEECRNNKQYALAAACDGDAVIQELLIGVYDRFDALEIKMAVIVHGVPAHQICTSCFEPMKPIGHNAELLCVCKTGKPGCDDPDPDAKKEV